MNIKKAHEAAAKTECGHLTVTTCNWTCKIYQFDYLRIIVRRKMVQTEWKKGASARLNKDKRKQSGASLIIYCDRSVKRFYSEPYFSYSSNCTTNTKRVVICLCIFAREECGFEWQCCFVTYTPPRFRYLRWLCFLLIQSVRKTNELNWVMNMDAASLGPFEFCFIYKVFLSWSIGRTAFRYFHTVYLWDLI